MKIEKFNNSTLEQIARAIGSINDNWDTNLNSNKIKNLLKEADIEVVEMQTTKWKFVLDSLIKRQNQTNCANNILNFVKLCYNPINFINNESLYEDKRSEINKILSFKGLEITKEGEIKEVQKSKTISEARQRANRFKEQLKNRKIHNEIFIYCGDEIEAENYFHMVFEAVKGIFDKLRVKTELTNDGADLVDEAFSFTNDKIPYLALNRLTTVSEKSEQKGFMNLIKGVYGTFRTPEAHEVKIKWIMQEDEALDILSLVSLIYRKIDSSIEARKNCGIK